VERRPTIKVFGEEMPLKAEVSTINGYSAHADQKELLNWLDAVRAQSPDLKQVFLVHGEPAAQDALAAEVRARGLEVDAPPFGAVRIVR
jgi:metallo-beta-lactamase family protein